MIISTLDEMEGYEIKAIINGTCYNYKTKEFFVINDKIPRIFKIKSFIFPNSITLQRNEDGEMEEHKTCKIDIEVQNSVYWLKTSYNSVFEPLSDNDNLLIDHLLNKEK